MAQMSNRAVMSGGSVCAMRAKCAEAQQPTHLFMEFFARFCVTMCLGKAKLSQMGSQDKIDCAEGKQRRRMIWKRFVGFVFKYILYHVTQEM